MEFTHFNHQGRARMVDVSEKADTLRTATAKARVLLNVLCKSFLFQRAVCHNHRLLNFVFGCKIICRCMADANHQIHTLDQVPFNSFHQSCEGRSAF